MRKSCAQTVFGKRYNALVKRPQAMPTYTQAGPHGQGSWGYPPTFTELVHTFCTRFSAGNFADTTDKIRYFPTQSTVPITTITIYI